MNGYKKRALVTTDRSDTASFSCVYLCEIGNPPRRSNAQTYILTRAATGIIVARQKIIFSVHTRAHTQRKNQAHCVENEVWAEAWR